MTSWVANHIVFGAGWVRGIPAVTLSSMFYFLVLTIAVGVFLRFFLPAG